MAKCTGRVGGMGMARSHVWACARTVLSAFPTPRCTRVELPIRLNPRRRVGRPVLRRVAFHRGQSHDEMMPCFPPNSGFDS